MTLSDVLEGYGIGVDKSKLQILEEFSKFLVSSPVNLTSMSEEEIYHKGIAEVLYPLKEFPIYEKFIDIGTGGGIPGVVLEIYFDVEGVLVDSRRKKTDLLRNFVLDRGLNLDVVWARAEELARSKDHREKYMYATSKALAKTPIALELLAPFTMVGGYILLYKGPSWKEELEKSWDFMEELGVDLGDVIEYDLKTGEKRALLILEKFKSTPRRFPRKNFKRPSR